MTWATAADVLALTGLTVTPGKVAEAEAQLELITGIFSDPAVAPISGVYEELPVSATDRGVVFSGSVQKLVNDVVAVELTATNTTAAAVSSPVVALTSDPSYAIEAAAEFTSEPPIVWGMDMFGGLRAFVSGDLDAGVTASARLVAALLPGTTPPAPGVVPTLKARDRELLRRAVAYQAAWHSEQSDAFTRSEVNAISQDGESITPDANTFTLAPWARRALRRLSWRGTRSVRVRGQNERRSGSSPYDDDALPYRDIEEESVHVPGGPGWQEMDA